MPKNFSDRVLEWWVKFEAMKPGDAYEVKECSRKPEMFIEMCKYFIDHSENGMYFEFSNCYKYFKRFH